ncbi:MULTISPECIES: hypothetical protein [Microcystis]|uniref:hypothetical protein n=1 Tax=Microcystis TaxID=1125 RepID=UPI002E2F8BAA|nr:hypothetical protein [Microcystis aeruginosa]
MTNVRRGGVCSVISKQSWLSYSLCDQFNLYSSDRSLCPLCLCGSFHPSLGGMYLRIHFTHQIQESL